MYVGEIMSRKKYYWGAGQSGRTIGEDCWGGQSGRTIGEDYRRGLLGSTIGEHCWRGLSGKTIRGTILLGGLSDRVGDAK